jgi:hypothetical protein
VHGELQLVRDEVSYTTGLLGSCKAELIAGFEHWYNSAAQQHDEPSASGGMNGWEHALAPSGSSLISSRPESSSRDTWPSGAVQQQQQADGSNADGGGFGDAAGEEDGEAAHTYMQAKLASGGMRRAGRVSSLKQHRGERGTFSTTGRGSMLSGWC